MMDLGIQIFTICISVLFNVLIFVMLRKEVVELKYTLLWILAGLAMLIFSIFPQIIQYFSSLLGISMPINTLFFFAILFLLVMLLMVTVIISRMKNRVHSMSQRMAILQNQIEDLEKKLQERE
jgi:hypothetical protein